jgi:hypothetical protein
VQSERTRVRRVASYAVWGVTACLFANLVRLAIPLSSSHRSPRVFVATPGPYTAILKEVVVKANGESIEAGRRTEALRSDGSYLLQVVAGRRDLFLASGEVVTINDPLKVKTTTRTARTGQVLRDSSPMHGRDLRSSCRTGSTAAVIGESTVAGYRAVQVATDRLNTWFSLDHGCALLKLRVDAASGKGRTETELVTLVPGEPDESLFRIPANYMEVSPSIYIAMTAKKDSPCPFHLETANAAKQADELYHKQHSGR